MSCNNCNGATAQYNPCNCGPNPCNTEPIIPVCNDPEYCDEVYTDKCIVHTGSSLPTIGAEEGVRLNTILANIENLLNQILNP